MKGLELSRKFYNELGEPMLREQFPELLPFVAVGLVGSGSECYGYDDKISRDHDFEPAFCIFIPDEDIVDSKTAFELERAYSRLPKQFMGFERSLVSAVGGSRHGVIRIGDFFEAKTGRRDGELSLVDWFSVPEYSLAESVNGAIFADNYGEFTKIREKLRYFPEDVRLKKLAGSLLLMGQAGQYNFKRCLARGENAAAQLAVFEFVKSALGAVFLLNKTYMPYYKWSFRALSALPRLSELSAELEHLISSGNSKAEADNKIDAIERICAEVSAELKAQGLTKHTSSEMEAQAYIVNDAISDGEIRNMHILSAV
ncbi:MAG: DUF4037 domain-containing protein [Oscillospiraceae bacterium]|nr:DUF4037 domain-containing protein [Oscillospiraceae bacterium]